MRPRCSPSRWVCLLAIAAALGVATSLAIAFEGAILGITRLDTSKPSPGVAVVAPDDREAIIYREWRTSWCIREIIMDRTTTPIFGRSGVGLGSDRGFFNGRPLTQRIAAPPLSCHPPTGKANVRIEYQIGWPRPCLWGAQDESQYADMVNYIGTTHILRVWPTSSSKASQSVDSYFPFLPFRQTSCHFIATGVRGAPLLLDSVMFAVAWWVLLLVPGSLRRSLRLRRNRRPHCNYDLRATPPASPCPECGRPRRPAI